jgi:hypothetical protein
MAFSRREFMKWAASASGLAIAAPGRSEMIPLFAEGVDASPDSNPGTTGYSPDLLPTQKDVWDWQVWMAKLGPKYTGNKAHSDYIEFLAKNLDAFGLEVTRDQYTFPRWDARRWEITVHPASGASFKVPVTSYYPYSGETPPEGVTGELIYAGVSPDLTFGPDVEGKIVFIESSVLPRPIDEWYSLWGVNPADKKFPASFRRPCWQTVGMLTDLKKNGALGVILGWTDISDGNAKDQYVPFSRPHQNIPGLWVGRETSKKLLGLAGTGAKATVVLEADVFQDAPTDTLIAMLPGISSDEIIIINTHTDGPNANEENGGIGLLALAKYFSQIPKEQRKRTLAFVMATGHFAGFAVPSIRGVIDKHPDLIKKSVAALTIEHLGARDWSDDAALNYKPTGSYEWGYAMTPLKSTADIMVECLKGAEECNVAVLNPTNPVAGAGAHFFGEGSALSRAGVPTIGYCPVPNYLLAGPQDGCIEMLSPERLHAEIEVFAKVIHKMDTMSAAALKGG